MKIVIVILIVMFACKANAEWKLVGTTYTYGPVTKIYYDSDRVVRTKNSVTIYLGKNMYPRGNEVEELSRVKINCKNPGPKVQFQGSNYGNIKAKNFLHADDLFERLVSEVCLNR
jgi:hypothetical protein